MHVSVTDAKAQLTALVRRAEAGEEVVLTRHGHRTFRLVPATAAESAEERKTRRRAILKAVRGSAKGMPGFEGVTPPAPADFLYNDEGLPA